jgi:hypothetical protein
MDFTNFNYIGTIASEARVVSGGIKVMPLVALTATPGVVYAGNFPGMTRNAMVAMTPNMIAASPLCQQGYGPQGGLALMLPESTQSYEFRSEIITGVGGAVDQPMSCPMICGIGFPPNTNVIVQYTLNLEILPQYNAVTSNFTPSLVETSPSLASLGVSPDAAIRYIRSTLGAATRVFQGAAVASLQAATGIAHSVANASSAAANALSGTATSSAANELDELEFANELRHSRYNAAHPPGVLAP